MTSMIMMQKARALMEPLKLFMNEDRGIVEQVTKVSSKLFAVRSKWTNFVCN